LGTTNDTDPNPLDTTGWTTTFFDGFNDGSLDSTKWSSVYDGAVYWNGAFEWDADQVSVGDGELTIGMEKREDGLWNAGAVATLSPGDDSAGYDFTYGRVEIRAKVSEEVTGAGPCFLLWPSSADKWPPEIDILETPQGEGMFTNHWQGAGGDGDDEYEAHHFDLDSSQWHTYALEWAPDHMTLFVDGEEVHTFTGNIPTEEMSIALQGHVGTADDGWYLSPNDSGVNNVDISVDWVRVSQYTGETSSETTTEETSGTDTSTTEEASGTDTSTTEEASGTDTSTTEEASGTDTSTTEEASGTDTSTTEETSGTDTSTSNTGSDSSDLATVEGTTGDDWLTGTELADLLLGGAGIDDLQGHEGDDRLIGGADHDGLTLGDGADTVVFARGDNYDWVVDFTSGTDHLELQGIEASEVTQTQETRWDMAGLLLDLGNGDSIFLQGVSELRDGDILFG
jgi:beta-glucanase (GH16 family)